MSYKDIVLKELQESILLDIHQYRDFLKMIIPKSEQDKKLANLAIDMLTQLGNDIQSAEDIYDLKDWFNVGELVDNWVDIKEDLTTLYSRDVIMFSELAEKAYEAGLPVEESHMILEDIDPEEVPF